MYATIHLDMLNMGKVKVTMQEIRKGTASKRLTDELGRAIAHYKQLNYRLVSYNPQWVNGVCEFCLEYNG